MLGIHPSHREWGCWTGRRSAWLCPCHSQCPLLLLALARCWWPWQLEQWSQEHLGQACNRRRPPWSVGSQLWLWPLLLGLFIWLNGLRLLLGAWARASETVEVPVEGLGGLEV